MAKPEKVLGIVEATAEEKAKAARTAFLASRDQYNALNTNANEHGRRWSRILDVKTSWMRKKALQ